MPDHNRVGRPTSVLAASFVIGGCSLAISAWALEPAEDGSAVVYGTNDLGMQFVSVPGGQFSMGCPEGAKPVECSAVSCSRHMRFRDGYGRQGSPDRNSVPVIVWNARGAAEPGISHGWRKFASNLVEAQPLPTGHYMQEEAPDQVYDHFAKFLTA